MSWTTILIFVGVGIAGVVRDEKDLVGIFFHEHLEGLGRCMDKDDIGENIELAKYANRDLFAVARGID